MNKDIKNLVMFTSKVLICGLIIYLIIVSMFGNIFKSIERVENMMIQIENIFNKVENMYNDDLSDMRILLDGTIQNYEVLYLLAKKQYESKNYIKSLHYLNLIEGIPNIKNKKMDKILELRQLVETKVN